jgi:SAM-dependent methyltransferase
MAGNFSNLLFPGRHHVLTVFQHRYLRGITQAEPECILDINHQSVNFETPVNLIWAVTSANHSNTRRNPFPAHRREAAIEHFISDLDLNSFVYLINDLGSTHKFAAYMIKEIEVQSEGRFVLTPQDTVVACSTPSVIQLFEELGFRILPVELLDRTSVTYSHPRPWDVVKAIAAAGPDWCTSQTCREEMHPASLRLLEKYRLGDLIVRVFDDPLLGDEGDITQTRNYNTYARAFDEGAARKYALIDDFIVPGRIVDIGCANGSIIKLMSEDQKLRESDLYGIEVARRLYEMCEYRRANGEFSNENVFFYQRNITRGKLFRDNSLNTVTTFSLTHEIESYLGRKMLLQFLRHIYDQLAPGGVFLNVDVIGPNDKDKIVFLKLAQDDGQQHDVTRELELHDDEDLTSSVEGLSTYGRFLRFVQDFRPGEPHINYEIVPRGGQDLIKVRLEDACEFLTKKDYTDNWQSEMHERFCFWTFDEWRAALEAVGFQANRRSYIYRNEWIVENRWKGKAELYEEVQGEFVPLEYPPTTMVMIAVKSLVPVAAEGVSRE